MERTRTWGVGLVAVAVAALTPLLADAQERVERLDLPRHVAAGVVDFFNDPSTLRFNGAARIPEGRLIVGDVGALGGPFTVEGEIDGDLVVLNGDLRLRGGGRVTGDVTVVGGRLREGDEGAVGGTLTVYDEDLRYVAREGKIVAYPRPDHDDALSLGIQSRFTVKNGGSYNRVEGLPVLFGPVVRLGGDHPFRAEALGLWRTESGFTLDDDDMGWLLRAEQRFRTRPALAVGVTFHSTVNPISDHGLSDLETSLATFLLHRDYRDFYERKGWSAFGRMEFAGTPVDLTLELRDESHAFAAVSSPWTLRKNDEPWRAQPLVGEGDLQTLSARVALDDRNDPDDPTHGWYVRLGVTQGLGGDLHLPARIVDGLVAPADPVDEIFTAGTLDARRYSRLGPDSDVAFRLFYGGSVDGGPLPPQYQHALGGEGSLPGYRLFSMDCGARRSSVVVERAAYDDESDATQPAFPYFGCDRALMFQAEYRGRFGFEIDFDPRKGNEWDEDWDWYPVIDLTPSWSAFFDAGRGWSAQDSVPDTKTFADVGVGFFLGDLGFYWALPLRGEDRKVNFFVRLERRF